MTEIELRSTKDCRYLFFTFISCFAAWIAIGITSYKMWHPIGFKAFLAWFISWHIVSLTVNIGLWKLFDFLTHQYESEKRNETVRGEIRYKDPEKIS